MDRTTVRAEDEERHVGDDERFWAESYYLDFVSDDGSLGGYLRLGFYPNLDVVWWTAAIVEPGKPTILSVSYDAPILDSSTASASGPGYSVTLDAVDPLKKLDVTAHGDAQSFDDPTAIYRGEAGTPISLEMDLRWQTDGTPYHYELTTRYEIPCLVSGELRIGDRTVAVQGQGQRDHSWGVRDWWVYGWCWSAARFDDGTRIHATDVHIPGVDVAFGYIQTPSGKLEVVASAVVTEDLGPEGLPTKARAVLNDGALVVEIEPLGFGPLLLTSPEGQISRFPRAMARFTDQSGRSGLGWVEWNQPEGI